VKPLQVKINFQVVKVVQVDTDAECGVAGWFCLSCTRKSDFWLTFVRFTQGYFDQFWTDPRLGIQSGSNLTMSANSVCAEGDAVFGDRCDTSLGLRYYLASSLSWQPDTVFTSASSVTYLFPYGGSDPYFQSEFFRVYETGFVHVSNLIELVLPVTYAIAFFPYEVIPVVLTVESYGNLDDVLQYVLTPDAISGLATTDGVPGYRIHPELVNMSQITDTYPEGSYSGWSVDVCVVAVH
jgi:hypothetical protein